MGRRLGLIIGINSYQDTSFRPLQYAETDARALAQWLVNTQGGHWSPADVQLVQGAYATRELVETLITQLCTTVAVPGDIVLVYFAGHAFLDETNGEGYLALANTRYNQPSTALHLPTLAQQAMARSRATSIAFIFDCFQTGSAWKMRRSYPYDNKALPGPTILNALQQTKDRMILCSCRGNEFGAESGEKNLGTLAYRMILGLCGPASDPSTGRITLQRLHAFLFSTLDEQHRPQLFGQEQAPMVLVGEMPQLQSGQYPPLDSAPLSSSASGQLPQTYSTGTLMTQAPPVSRSQLAPNPSGQLMNPTTEQQCDMLMRQARHLIQMQNPGQAFHIVEQVLTLAPTLVPALILKGQLLGTIGRFQDALNVVDQIIQIDANNALAWSMRAALLTNTGQYQLALQAIEHSLELDPNNPETYSIKTSIMAQVASFQSQDSAQASKSFAEKQGGPKSFMLNFAVLLLGFIMGIVGVALPIIKPGLPIMIAFVLESLGLAFICVFSFRSSYLYGFPRFLLTLFFSGLAAGLLAAAALLGGLNKIGQGRVYLMVQKTPDLLLPLIFLGIWLAAAAILPALLGLFGLIGGLIVGVRRKRK